MAAYNGVCVLVLLERLNMASMVDISWGEILELGNCVLAAYVDATI